MKTKYWIFLFAAIFLVCGGLTILFFLPGDSARQAQILCDGQVLYTVDLAQDQTYPIQTSYGANTIQVKDGKIAVIAADCPDGYCMQRGWCDSGADIVCLPHHLSIRFVAPSELDAMTGQ